MSVEMQHARSLAGARRTDQVLTELIAQTEL
jgi:hypothetical protein